jgi:hypothetical protein
MATTEVKDRKAFIRVRISLAKEEHCISEPSGRRAKKAKAHHGEKGRGLHQLVTTTGDGQTIRG